jgi:hypothetical protein
MRRNWLLAATIAGLAGGAAAGQDARERPPPPPPFDLRSDAGGFGGDTGGDLGGGVFGEPSFEGNFLSEDEMPEFDPFAPVDTPRELQPGELRLDPAPGTTGALRMDPPRESPRIAVTAAAGGVLRALDKLSGQVEDLELSRGQTVSFGRIEVTLDDCRYPTENPSGDAFAHVTVRRNGMETPQFSGWMIASSPALSALDDPRYDVWVSRCTTS